MYSLQFANPLAYTFVAGDDYCGTVVPHFPFPRGGGFNPGNVLPQAGQKGIIIVSG
jgi:hypothetical protein